MNVDSSGSTFAVVMALGVTNRDAWTFQFKTLAEVADVKHNGLRLYNCSSHKNLRSSGIATSTIICIICGNMWQYSNYDTYCYWVCGHVGPSHNGGLLQRFFFSFGNLPGQVPIYRSPPPFLVIHPPGTATINNKRAAVTCNTSTSPSIQYASMIHFFDSVQWISMVDSVVLYLIGVIPWLLRLVFVFIIDLPVFWAGPLTFFPDDHGISTISLLGWLRPRTSYWMSPGITWKSSQSKRFPLLNIVYRERRFPNWACLKNLESPKCSAFVRAPSIFLGNMAINLGNNVICYPSPCLNTHELHCRSYPTTSTLYLHFRLDPPQIRWSQRNLSSLYDMGVA